LKTRLQSCTITQL